MISKNLVIRKRNLFDCKETYLISRNLDIRKKNYLIKKNLKGKLYYVPKLGDEYVMESGMCGYNVEITKRNLFVAKRNLFDLKETYLI